MRGSTVYIQTCIYIIDLKLFEFFILLTIAEAEADLTAIHIESYLYRTNSYGAVKFVLYSSVVLYVMRIYVVML